MDYQHGDQPGPISIALLAGLGLGVGILCGLVAGELLGDVDADRMKRALKNLRPADEDLPEVDLADLERDLKEALTTRPEVRTLDIEVRALGEGLVELTGLAPDETTRTIAGKVAERVPGADVVVNRILVEGIDTLDQPTASISRAP